MDTKQNALGLDFKHRYNKVLERQNKAEEWINTNKPDMKAREYIGYKKILGQLNNMIREAELHGHKMSHEETVKGFKL